VAGIALFNKGKVLEYRTYQLDEQLTVIVDEKGVNALAGS